MSEKDDDAMDEEEDRVDQWLRLIRKPSRRVLSKMDVKDWNKKRKENAEQEKLILDSVEGVIHHYQRLLLAALSGNTNTIDYDVEERKLSMYQKELSENIEDLFEQISKSKTEILDKHE